MQIKCLQKPCGSRNNDTGQEICLGLLKYNIPSCTVRGMTQVLLLVYVKQCYVMFSVVFPFSPHHEYTYNSDIKIVILYVTLNIAYE